MRPNMALLPLMFVVLACVTAAGGAGAAETAAWKPSRNVEIVVPFAAGGGNDIPARILQKILTGKRMVDTPVNVVNKPGGGGTLGLIYLNEHTGDGHYLSLISTSTLTSHIIGTSKLNYTDVTPILPLITEYIAFAVNVSSTIETFSDVAARVKKDPSSLSFAIGGGLGNPNHTAVAAALKGAGGDVRKMKAVAFGGGKEALVAVLGGHVDVLAVAASVLAPQVKSGKLRIVAIAAPARLEGDLANVATLKEQGMTGVYGFSRYMVGPSGMPAAQSAYWEKTLGAILKSAEWKTEADRRNWDIPSMSAADTSKDLRFQYEQLHAVLSDLGMAKSPLAPAARP